MLGTVRRRLATGAFLILFSFFTSGASAAQNQTFNIDLPAQPLATSLAGLSKQTGMQIFAAGELVKGKSAPAVAGQMTAAEALDRLLAGSGLEAAASGAGLVVQLAKPKPAAEPQTQQDSAIALDPVVVKEQRDELPQPYAGGQVARGGRLGVLGNRDMMDTPFSQMNYTSQLIQDQQALSVGEVLRNDPFIKTNFPHASGDEFFSIRGFQVNSGTIMFNGLPGIAPMDGNAMMTESIERIEVFRGPNALLSGTAGNIGGMINIVPKRAGDEPLVQLTGSYGLDSLFGGHVDLGRRFGSDKQLGVRFNGAYRKGDTPISHHSRESGLGALGVDYRGDIFRLSSDFGYQNQQTRGARWHLNVAPGFDVPSPPDNRTNVNAPWESYDNRVFYGTTRGEVDVTRNITVFGGFGYNEKINRTALDIRLITDPQGTLAASDASLWGAKTDTWTVETGLRGDLHTGPVHHRAVVGYTHYTSALRFNFASLPTPESNLYRPVFGQKLSAIPDPDDGAKVYENAFSSAVLADTLAILNERVQLTLGIRFQQIKQMVGGSYDKRANTPMVGLVVKPWQHVSFYGNYIEGLEQSAIAPLTAANAGEVFPPFVSKGYEAGIKVDFGRFATTLAAFQLTRPNAFIDPLTNVFGVDGKQRNRGVEFSVFGEVIDGVRLLGGTSYIDAKLTKTEGGINEGNSATLPRFQLAIGGEWDVPFLKGFTMTSRVTHASWQYQDAENTRKIPSWAQWDLGARYTMPRSNGKPITIRTSVNNVLDSNAWYGSSDGRLIQRDPLTFLLSASFDF